MVVQGVGGRDVELMGPELQFGPMKVVEMERSHGCTT